MLSCIMSVIKAEESKSRRSGPELYASADCKCLISISKLTSKVGSVYMSSRRPYHDSRRANPQNLQAQTFSMMEEIHKCIKTQPLS